MSKIDINMFSPQKKGAQKEFVCTENGCRYTGMNSAGDPIRQFKVDGEVLKRGSPEKRCDYLFLNDNDINPRAYFVELKGSDLLVAIEQIDNTVFLVADSITSYRVYRRIVYRTGTHKIQDARVVKWKKKHYGFVKIENRSMIDDLCQDV